MEFSSGFEPDMDEIAALFEAVFTASEGREEGRLIGGLAKDLMTTTESRDIRDFSARDDGALVGCIIFTRLDYPQDSRTVFLLSPVAVATSRQGKGIGQALLKHGLDELRARGVDIAVTYGDPGYYSKLGFAQISAYDASPPQKLSMPHGWLGQDLTIDAPLALKGPSRCVPALDDPDYW